MPPTKESGNLFSMYVRLDNEYQAVVAERDALREVVELAAGTRNDGGFSPTQVQPLRLRRLARKALERPE